MARRRLPGPVYRVSATFRAQVDFAFRWCTHYTPGDAKLEGERYERRIVEASPRRVIYEDLEWTSTGWDLKRTVVTLKPPRRWSMVAVGNRVDVAADYVLTPLPKGGSRLDLSWRRKPKGPQLHPLTKAQRERSSTRSWVRFAKALDRDYRTARRR